VKLFYSNGSPFARKVRIVLIEKGLVFESDISDGGRPIDEAPAPTLAIPVLEDGDLRLWESDVIVDYLMRTYPQATQPAGDLPLMPGLTRPDQHWHDMMTLATISTCGNSIVNLRAMQGDGITPDNSDYMDRQKTRAERCLDWLEMRVTPEGFAAGWFSVMDIAFICVMSYCEGRDVMPWRGRPRLEALYDGSQSRPSVAATPIPWRAPTPPRYMVERRPVA